MAIQYIEQNKELSGLARMQPDVVFSTASGAALKMQLLTPWNDSGRYPLIVFVQGSGFQFPDVYYELPQLAEYARRGYVVATVTHRSCLDGHPAPAYLQDVKTAIRFLRANAEKYCVDPARVCAFGTSSGGNTVLLLGLTGDDDSLKTDEYREQSDAVQAVVECFGPTDMTWMLENTDKDDQPFIRALAGKDCADLQGKAVSISPLRLLSADKPCPPTLIIHGDADPVVDYRQGKSMYERLLECGKDAEMICVKGAPHEGSFWSRELHGLILNYIGRKL